MADTLNETKVGGTETVATETQAERTFTESEVNKMMEARIGKERAKFADYDELKAKASRFDEIEDANKSELQKATERADALQSQLDSLTKANEIRDIRNKVSTDTGVPAELLTADTEETCKAQAESILKFAKPNGYPTVRDGGESRVPESKDKVKQFEDWFNEQLG